MSFGLKKKREKAESSFTGVSSVRLIIHSRRAAASDDSLGPSFLFVSVFIRLFICCTNAERKARCHHPESPTLWLPLLFPFGFFPSFFRSLLAHVIRAVSLISRRRRLTMIRFLCVRPACAPCVGSIVVPLGRGRWIERCCHYYDSLKTELDRVVWLQLSALKHIIPIGEKARFNQDINQMKRLWYARSKKKLFSSQTVPFDLIYFLFIGRTGDYPVIGRWTIFLFSIGGVYFMFLFFFSFYEMDRCWIVFVVERKSLESSWPFFSFNDSIWYIAAEWDYLLSFLFLWFSLRFF